MNHSPKHPIRVISLLLALSLLLSTCALAAPSAAPDDLKTGTFRFQLEENSGCDTEDVYVYSDDWFQTSASAENPHLATMSLIMTMASGASNEKDGYPDQSRNLTALLGELGFTGIALNQYYREKPGEQSIGCCIAQKPITIGRDGYTLLAIVPRSQGYEQEWTGNFTVGKTGLHEGFKAARDEVLRFAQQYVQANNLTDQKLKVWITGYSRGAAAANLAAGFLVDFPGWLSEQFVPADDLYAFTFGTPQGVPADLTMAQEGNVEAVASGTSATPGGGQTTDSATVIDPQAVRYGVIRNYISANDPVPMVMPSALAFSRYGTDTCFTVAWADSKATADVWRGQMRAKVSGESLLGEDPAGFHAKTILSGDDGFSIGDDAAVTMTASKFLHSRIDMLVRASGGTRQSYVNGGYEQVLKELCSFIFGGTADTELLLNSLKQHPDDALTALVELYFYYPLAKRSADEESVNAFAAGLIGVSLALMMSPKLMTEKLDGLIQALELTDVTANKLLTALQDLLYDMRQIADAQYADPSMLLAALREDTAKRVQTLLGDIIGSLNEADQSQYAWLKTNEASLAFTDLAANLAFGNTDSAPFNMITLSPPGLVTDTAELKTLATIIGNLEMLISDHVNANALSWFRARDSFYIAAGLPEGSYSDSQTVELFCAPGAAVYYTLDGSDPTADEDCRYTGAVTLEDPGFLKTYTLKAFSVDTDGQTGPTWEFIYTVGSGYYGNAAPPPKPNDEQPEETAPAAPFFEDVDETDYFADAVAWAAETGVTLGTSETTFSPKDNCARSEIITFLWRAFGSPETEQGETFSDVPAGSYYEKAAAWARGCGVANGTADGGFDPLGECTRAEVVTFLWRAAGCPAASGEGQFADVDGGSYYAAAVAWAVENGITLGTSESTFSPDAVCTRAQVVTFLFRCMK